MCSVSFGTLVTTVTSFTFVMLDTCVYLCYTIVTAVTCLPMLLKLPLLPTVFVHFDVMFSELVVFMAAG